LRDAREALWQGRLAWLTWATTMMTGMIDGGGFRQCGGVSGASLVEVHGDNDEHG